MLITERCTKTIPATEQARLLVDDALSVSLYKNISKK